VSSSLNVGLDSPDTDDELDDNFNNKQLHNSDINIILN